MGAVGLRENEWNMRMLDVDMRALLSSDEIARVCKQDG